jgi:hypothetical protein
VTSQTLCVGGAENPPINIQEVVILYIRHFLTGGATTSLALSLTRSLARRLPPTGSTLLLLLLLLRRQVQFSNPRSLPI